ncbi:MAG: gamma-glutamyl-gamma-aminobutyrate hydrolase family protein [Rhodobiaceae bacterium]|nr:gamma-glutamyl-gamma-aminobutyrate hydrolase family protein [Rhodobiaceae bacterium]MCC0040899.1 gamma-glutamyl-gamma-aminobutyrate hydrolase family protein [Rhodobiaceae bacterium]
MSTTPIVIVSTDVKEIDGYRWHAAPQQYLKALAGPAGVLPLMLPSLGEAIDIPAVLARCDGVLLTGSRSNIHPPHYGGEAHARHEPFDHERDATTLALARHALDAGVPLFAICRGHQELNVALGGSIAGEIQEEEGRMDHRAADSTDNNIRFQMAHTVRPRKGGLLHRILESDEVIVNSLHRQAIGKLAPSLVIEASAEDGTIEATTAAHAKAFALSVQWHPEYWAGSDPVSTKLFAAFGDACRAHRAERLKAA